MFEVAVMCVPPDTCDEKTQRIGEEGVEVCG